LKAYEKNGLQDERTGSKKVFILGLRDVTSSEEMERTRPIPGELVQVYGSAQT
jgi:hypothetical protein